MLHRVLIAAAVAACSYACLAAERAGAADPAHEALARHAAYTGRADALVTTYRLVRPAPTAAPGAAATPVPAPASSPAPAFAAAEVTTYRRGALYHRIERAQGVSIEAGFNGRAFWTADENRYAVIALEDAAKRAITENAFEGQQFGDADVQSRGAQTIDGKQADVVRVTPKGGVPMDVAVDASGAALQVTFDPDVPYRKDVQRITGYTEISPGVRVPSGFKAGRGSTLTLVQGAVRVVSDDDLRGPAPTPVWTFGANAAPIEVRRRTYSGGREVVLHASINGHPGTFLLDSGAGQILLYRPYADKLGLAMLGGTTYSGINGGVRSAKFARAETIAVGDSTLSNVIVSVSGREMKDPVDGILGFDLLAGAVVHVDLAHETISFADPAQVQPAVGKGAFAFPVNLADNTPEVLVKVAGIPTRATFDTGDDFFMTLSDSLKTSGRLVSVSQSMRYFTGVDGVTVEPESCYDVKESSIGPYRYENVTVCLGKESVFGKDGGLIGFDFLRHFNWTFDYPRAHIVLTPNGL
jgi:Aspartyl protease